MIAYTNEETSVIKKSKAETEEVVLLDCEFVSLFVERIGVNSSSDEKDHRARVRNR